MESFNKGKQRDIYLAAPLFSQAERGFNANLARRLRGYVTVFLPQEDGGLMSDMIDDGVSPIEAARRVFAVDLAAIEQCDLLLIVMDGRSIDEGAAFELGYAFARGKRCVGLQTDSRRLMNDVNNPMISAPLEVIFENVDDLERWIATEFDSLAGGIDGGKQSAPKIAGVWRP